MSAIVSAKFVSSSLKSSRYLLGWKPACLNMQRRSLLHNHRALDHVLQLANIAGPRVRLQQLHTASVDALYVFSHLKSESIQKIFAQRPDVSCPLSQCRHANDEYAQSIEQVLAKPSCGDSRR